MAAPISQKDYLKKYLAGSSKKEKKKKKKRPKNLTQSRLHIVDDDVGGHENVSVHSDENPGESELYEDPEERPQVAGVIDERPELVQKLEVYRTSSKWRTVTEDAQGKPSVENIYQDKLQETLSTVVGRSTQSRTKHGEKRHNDNNTLLTQRKHNSIQSASKSRTPQSADGLPVKSHSRHDMNQSHPKNRNEPVQSAAKYRHDQSPSSVRPRHDSDQSPTRSRQRHDSDQSPPRTRQRHGSDQSQPRTRERHDSDQSPPRTRQRHDSDQSPPRARQRHNSDQPPSRARQRHDSDQSPPRSRQRHDSDQSPPRKRKQHDSDQSPPRKFKSGSERSSRNDGHTADGAGRKMNKTMDGKKAGLQDARTLKKENDEHRQREMDEFSKLDDSVSGRRAQTTFRDKKTGKRVDMVEEKRKKDEQDAKQAELNAKYVRWNAGVKQVESRKNKLESDLYEMSKPLARYADDEDLEKHLKEQERDGDPMLQYIKSKKDKADPQKAKKPRYTGPMTAPNRYAIIPGSRWDGVDRSNGYEKKWFENKNKKKAGDEDAYKWSIEDM